MQRHLCLKYFLRIQYQNIGSEVFLKKIKNSISITGTMDKKDIHKKNINLKFQIVIY